MQRRNLLSGFGIGMLSLFGLDKLVAKDEPSNEFVGRWGKQTFWYKDGILYKAELPHLTRWYNPDGQLHRVDGPAVVDDGDKYWYQNDKLHRLGGPAVEYASGKKE